MEFIHKYELALILNPDLDEEGKAQATEAVTNLITRFGGEIEKVDDWGKKRLAYEIDKKNEGFYSFITFSAKHDTPIEIENRIRIMENVIRYLIIRQDV